MMQLKNVEQVIKNMNKELSKEELFYWKLKNDRRWYMENFLKIRNKKAELVPLNLNEAQVIINDIIDDCERNNKLKRFIVLKARQMGVSTLFEGLIFHNTANNEHVNSLIVAHEESASTNLFNMSKLFYECLPEVIRPMKKYSNGRILSFENPENDDKIKEKNPGLRSKISIATAGAGEVGRSATLHNLHTSEVAFFPNAQITMLGLLQSVPDEMNTMVILESTANGVGGWFHSMWQKAVKGESDFIPIFLPWFIDSTYVREFRSEEEKEAFIDEVNSTTLNPKGDVIRTYEYELMHKYGLTYEQLNWRKYTIQNKCEGDEDLFMQEYPSTPEEAFISTGRPRFSISALRKYQSITKEGMTGYLIENPGGSVDFIEDKKGYVTIWKKPDPNSYYCIGVDVAEGLAHGDYSCGVVGDSDMFDVVAMWHGHIDPDLLGVEMIKLGKYYNNAYIGVENNNHGLTTLTTLKKEEYWNIYFTKSYDKITERVTQKMGWTTTLRTKPLMIDKLAQFVREMYLGIYSDLMISEMFTYVRDDKGSTNALAGCYDDTVMAMAVCLQLMLEGRGEDYVPEVAIDDRGRVRKHIIDPLFESEVELEVSI